jgi:hypothetical protein
MSSSSHLCRRPSPPAAPPRTPPRPPPQGLDYAEWFEALKHKNQVHVEVY